MTVGYFKMVTISEVFDAVVDDDDLFQCGKCKKEFTNLVNFLSHKQGQCLGEVVANTNTSQPLTLRTSMDISTSNTSIVYTTHLGHAITKQVCYLCAYQHLRNSTCSLILGQSCDVYDFFNPCKYLDCKTGHVI